jgi:hypothetical protein
MKIVIIGALLFTLTIAFVYIIINKPTPNAVIYVVPQVIERAVGQSFMINVNISNIEDLYGWRLKLR